MPSVYALKAIGRSFRTLQARLRGYMGVADMRRQRPNVFRMRLLGADVRGVATGACTLKDAITAAMRDWVTHPDSYYLLGSALGPHPYPSMVRDFQAVIGHEARAQLLAQAGWLPDAVVACVSGGSNAIGIFRAFVDDAQVLLIGVEAGAEGEARGQHAARFAGGRPGVLQGTYSYVLQDDGQILATHSVSAGLDYATVCPEHAFLHDQGRARYEAATDTDVLDAFQLLCRTEGILPALESAHALVGAARQAPALSREQIILVNLSGWGDKDIFTVADELVMTV